MIIEVRVNDMQGVPVGFTAVAAGVSCRSAKRRCVPGRGMAFEFGVVFPDGTWAAVFA